MDSQAEPSLCVPPSCSICLCALVGENIQVAKCGHCFHAQCILNALELRPSCPECRMKLHVDRDVKKLFLALVPAGCEADADGGAGARSEATAMYHSALIKNLREDVDALERENARLQERLETAQAGAAAAVEAKEKEASAKRDLARVSINLREVSRQLIATQTALRVVQSVEQGEIEGLLHDLQRAERARDVDDGFVGGVLGSDTGDGSNSSSSVNPQGTAQVAYSFLFRKLEAQMSTEHRMHAKEYSQLFKKHEAVKSSLLEARSEVAELRDSEQRLRDALDRVLRASPPAAKRARPAGFGVFSADSRGPSKKNAQTALGEPMVRLEDSDDEDSASLPPIVGAAGSTLSLGAVRPQTSRPRKVHLGSIAAGRASHRSTFAKAHSTRPKLSSALKESSRSPSASSSSSSLSSSSSGRAGAFVLKRRKGLASGPPRASAVEEEEPISLFLR